MNNILTKDEEVVFKVIASQPGKTAKEIWKYLTEEVEGYVNVQSQTIGRVCDTLLNQGRIVQDNVRRKCEGGGGYAYPLYVLTGTNEHLFEERQARLKAKQAAATVMAILAEPGNELREKTRAVLANEIKRATEGGRPVDFVDLLSFVESRQEKWKTEISNKKLAKKLEASEK